VSRRLLVAEPDAPGRAMLDRVLTAAGYTAEEFASVHDARILLDDEVFDLAVVDEFAGADAVLGEVRFLRTHYPRLPVVVMGTMLNASVLLSLVRLGVADALPKPFTPDELRAAVARALVHSAPGRSEALDYAAAVAAARSRLAAGDLAGAGRSLVRAYAHAPSDAEVAALQALRAELAGDDADAARGYRSALALRHDEGAESPDPHEGLARLAAYGAARPVAALSPRFRGAPLWIVTDPARELTGAPPAGVGEAVVVVLSLSLGAEPSAAVPQFRERGDRAFALLPGDLRPEQAGALLARIGPGPLVAHPSGPGAELDLARMAVARDEALDGSSARPVARENLERPSAPAAGRL
jgi:DNA-binding response OmpR family regulator